MKNKHYLLITLLALGTFSSHAQTPFMVKDINIGSSNGLSIAPEFCDVNGTLFFIANNGINGEELWKSDGTPSGTIMVKDINPGSASSLSNLWPTLTNVNGTLYFAADDGVHGLELWKSDGTDAGTVLVKELTSDQTPVGPLCLINFNGTLYFYAGDGAFGGGGIYKSDGTSAGTVFVAGVGFDQMAIVGGTMFFAGEGSGGDGVELWKTDGTTAGTVQVKEIMPLNPGSNPVFLTNVNGTLFFVANDGVYGAELWKSDGTSAGTVMVKNIMVGGGNSGGGESDASWLTVLNGILYFGATDSIKGGELWRSDGTDAGTFMVKDIFPGKEGSFPRELCVMNGAIYFNAIDTTMGFGHGSELWKTDGTTAGTLMVKDIVPGYLSSIPTWLYNLNGTLYFDGGDAATTGAELWKSDGTEAGTVLVKDVNPGIASANPINLMSAGGKLFFSAEDGVNGTELWSLGSATGIEQLSKISSTINLYPNPSSGIINIKSKEPLSSIHIYNTLGVMVYSASINSLESEIDLSAQASGIYTVQIKSGQQTYYQKLLKQ